MDKKAVLSQEEALDLVRNYKRVIGDRFGVEPQVIMFGSYSKGCANSDSDIDVAVIVPKIEEGKLFEWSKSLWHDIDKVSVLIEPILMEAHENSPLYRDVMRTGIAV